MYKYEFKIYLQSIKLNKIKEILRNSKRSTDDEVLSKAYAKFLLEKLFNS